MSDAIPAPSRSPPAEEVLRTEPVEEKTTTNEVANEFVPNSQEASATQEPVAAEDSSQKLAKNEKDGKKRKRTSPEDQATLEAEYKKNPKPDKSARLAIVELVSLNEKEVQIWFQNRRQNTRRKSRPLLPHEVAAFGLGSVNSNPRTSHHNQHAHSSEESPSSLFNGSFCSSQGDSIPSNSQPEPTSISRRASQTMSQPQSRRNSQPLSQPMSQPVFSQPEANFAEPPQRISPTTSNVREEVIQVPSSPPMKPKTPTTISLQTPAPSRTTMIPTLPEASLPTFTPLKPSYHRITSFTSASDFLVSAPTPAMKTPGTGYLANRWNMSSICGTPNTERKENERAMLGKTPGRTGGGNAVFMTPGPGKEMKFMTPGEAERDLDGGEEMELPTSAGSGAVPLDFHTTTKPTETPRTNKSTSSGNVRLSLDLDGRASLVSADLSSSPPRPPPTPYTRPVSSLSGRRTAASLQRSHSATGAVSFSLSSGRSNQSTPTSLPMPVFTPQSGAQYSTPQSAITSFSKNTFRSSVSSMWGSAPRLPTGRSRDARSWEQCATTTSASRDDELTMLADNESSGSAVAALSFIRSTSGKAMKGNGAGNKRNVKGGEKQGSGKKVKRTLDRQQSALGRLQSTAVGTLSSMALQESRLNVQANATMRRQAMGEVDHNKKRGGSGYEVVLSPGDDEKENWVPSGLGVGQNGSVRRPLPAYRAPSNVGTSPLKLFSPTAARRTGSTPSFGRNRKKEVVGVYEDGSGGEESEGEGDVTEDRQREKETSEEVERFMRGASPGKKGDLDCIQGLLSLSQGNWR